MRLALFVLILAPAALAQSAAEKMLQDYFGRQTTRIAERALAGIQSLEDWKVRRETYREQIREMLELENLPSTLARAGSFPNALRYFDLPQIMALAFPRSLLIRSAMPSDWDWTVKISKLVGGKITFG